MKKRRNDKTEDSLTDGSRPVKDPQPKRTGRRGNGNERPPRGAPRRASHTRHGRIESNIMMLTHVVASSASSLPTVGTAVRGNTTSGSSSTGSSSSIILPRRGNSGHVTRAVAGPRIIVDGGAESAMRGLSEKRREVIEDMGSFAGGELMGLLKDPETNWQPQDWLPDPSRDDFLDQVRRRRRTSRNLDESPFKRRARAQAYLVVGRPPGLGLGLGRVRVTRRRSCVGEGTMRVGDDAWVMTRCAGYDGGLRCVNDRTERTTERLTEFIFLKRTRRSRRFASAPRTSLMISLSCSSVI